MKKVVLVGVLVSALGGVASAAERPVKAPYRAPPAPPAAYYSWTGFYIGGNIGGAWSHGSVEDSLFGLSASTRRSGFIGGGQLGFNYQFSNIVLGVEWDFDWTSLNATGSGRSTPIGFLQASADTRWVSTLAGRFGVAAWDGGLLYGKAGWGWVDNSATVTNLTTGASISRSNRNGGWMVGAGVEWALAANWSAKFEYDFLRLDSQTFGPGPFLGDTFTTNREIHMLKVGLNYKFGYGGPAYGGPGYGGPGYGGPGYRAY
jgi:outer membrane immunogenic protein